MTDHEHHGHRERMRTRFLKSGLDGFAPHEALELLLFYAIPQRNVNPLAHQLLKHFGSLGAVLDASPEQLRQVAGIGDNAATLLSFIRPLLRYVERERMGEKPVITNYREAKAFCKHLFIGESQEVLYVICLDAQGRVLREVPAIEGTIDELHIYPRTIIEAALLHNAHSVLLAHNHPSGACEPSAADIQTTQYMRHALSAVDIALLDHVVYGDGECVSIMQWVDRQQQALPQGESRLKAADTKYNKNRKPQNMPPEKKEAP